MMWRLKVLATGLVDWTDPTTGTQTTELFDWADRCAAAGFHGSKSAWLRQRARIAHDPVPVTRKGEK